MPQSTLRLEVVSPKTGDDASSVKDVKMRVKYPDGSLVIDDRLNATVGGSSVSLQRIGEYFEGFCSVPANTSQLDIQVFDRQGNLGLAMVRLTPSASGGGLDAMFQMLLPILILLFVVLPILIIVYKALTRKKEEGNLRNEQYHEVKKRLEPAPTEDDKRLNDWVSEKLAGGEDPEVLKKGLEEMGFDPGIVDRVEEKKSAGSE